MIKTNLRKIWWLFTFLYVVLIYATLGIMPRIWDKLDSLASGKLVSIFYIFYAVVAVFIFVFILFVKKEKSPLKFILFLFFMGITIATLKFAKFPAEKVHIAEYGLLGVLLYNALKIDFDRFGNKLYIIGMIACSAIGALDEVIQLILPNRYFDWRDIFMNGLCGMIALLMIKFNILDNLKAKRIT